MMFHIRHPHRRWAPFLLCGRTFYHRRVVPNHARYLTTKEGDFHGDFREQLKELQEERELLFGFTKEETAAWEQQGSSLNTSHVEAMNQARIRHFERLDQQQQNEEINDINHDMRTTTTLLEPQFTHVSSDGAEVSMVDVGQKQVTQRVARARTTVLFPPEVMSAFQLIRADHSTKELVGPKGPIFSTAKLAGIMAAKKTSDLIPLCHPLPLDRVHVEISLVDNVATIECECRATHKTGVEMEALTGATITALTIYDMVKAVSHKVEISHTMLVSKSGGKRNITDNDVQ